jgi:Transglycosylase-like domain
MSGSTTGSPSGWVAAFLANRAATDAEVLSSITVLERMLAPVQSPARTNSSASAPATPSTSTRTGGLPACASESGSNYSTGSDNTNASSGATGRYQILPSTAAAYGCSLATPAGQDACAQVIYEHQGAGAWVGCGG